MVIRSVSEALRRILWDAIAADDVTRQIVVARENIVFLNPTQTASDSSRRLSLWLYQVVEDEFVKNQPMLRAELPDPTDARGRHRDEFPPMALDLMYLLTPFAQTGESDHLLLGKAIQALYDSASTVMTDVSAGVAEELRIVFHRHTLEELTRIWDALKEPYRLSVCYQVKVTRVDSGRRSANARVVELSEDYGPTPAAVPV
jgi:Pvc16 N-terminal domain